MGSRFSSDNFPICSSDDYTSINMTQKSRLGQQNLMRKVKKKTKQNTYKKEQQQQQQKLMVRVVPFIITCH